MSDKVYYAIDKYQKLDPTKNVNYETFISKLMKRLTVLKTVSNLKHKSRTRDFNHLRDNLIILTQMKLGIKGLGMWERMSAAQNLTYLEEPLVSCR